MERLEPVLKQKFWILLGIAILMTFVGWSMATATMSKDIAERKTKIEAAFSNVPSGVIPHESWTKQLAAINEKQESSIKLTQSGLWKRQLVKMNGPQGLDPKVAPYEGRFSNSDQEQFRYGYPDEVRRVWKMLNPMDIDGTGVVDYPMQRVYALIGKGPRSWPQAPPESKEIWDIMEDLWLLEGMFHSIVAVNGGLEAGRADASIHQIDKLEFRGGGEKLASSGSTGGGSGGAEGGMFGGGAMGMGMGGPRGGGGGGTGGAAGMMGSDAAMKPESAEFDPREEFGDDGSGSVGGGGGGGLAGYGSMMSGMAGGASGGGGEAPAASEKTLKRYVLDDKNLPYKTRGFYLSVKMDHRKIPQLIAELTANENSVWPVEVLRVQMSRLNEDDAGVGATGGGGLASRMPAGMNAGTLQRAMSSAPSALSGLRSEDVSAFASSLGGGGPTTGAASYDMNAKSLLDNALRDPNMAQVTLCGVFYMYNKAEEPAPATPPAADTPAKTDEVVNPDNPEPKDAATENATSPEKEEKEEAAAAPPTTEADETADLPVNPDENREPGEAKMEDDQK